MDKIRNAYSLALASSSPNLFVEAVAGKLQINNYYSACDFIFDQNDTFVEIHYTGIDRDAKVEYLKRLTKEYKIKPNQIIYVGDSENDLGAFEFTGKGILVGSGNTQLRNSAWKNVKNIVEITTLL